MPACPAALLSALPAKARDEHPPGPTRYDLGAAVNALADSTPGEGTSAAPFLGPARLLSVDPLFGSATTSIPIALPPGRKGLTPDVTLRYTSSGGPSLFGIGWSLPLGAISRRSNLGTPLAWTPGGAMYDDGRGFDLFLGGTTVVLDRCLAGTPCTSWAASNEDTWLGVTLNRGANRWEVRDAAGMTYRYGEVAAARSGMDPTRFIDMTGDGLPEFVSARMAETPGACCTQFHGACTPPPTCMWDVFPNNGGTLAETPIA